ncbi:unnamed protein product [Spirodela intermedia]|uniref:Uncharacterized protein n=1 Tax=Spirodela intermedia TaxID=51605 RepID=A0A7I8KFT0_SPIIN|nr:unnamed protein product [Spirodela intermedia]
MNFNVNYKVILPPTHDVCDFQLKSCHVGI